MSYLRSAGGKWAVLYLAVAALLPASGLRGQTPTTMRTVSVLQFLIDSDGTGLFTPTGAYCIADGRVEGGAEPAVTSRLTARSGRIVGSDACESTQPGATASLDGAPAVWLWARPGTPTEVERSRPSIVDHDWSDAAVLMRAGFRVPDLRVEYQCWVREGAEPHVLRCDTRIVS